MTTNVKTNVKTTHVASPKMNSQRHSDKYCGDCGFKIRGKNHIDGMHHKSGSSGHKNRCHVGNNYK